LDPHIRVGTFGRVRRLIDDVVCPEICSVKVSGGDS